MSLWSRRECLLRDETFNEHILDSMKFACWCDVKNKNMRLRHSKLFTNVKSEMMCLVNQWASRRMTEFYAGYSRSAVIQSRWPFGLIPASVNPPRWLYSSHHANVRTVKDAQSLLDRQKVVESLKNFSIICYLYASSLLETGDDEEVHWARQATTPDTRTATCDTTVT
jgi:hypothetical protein